MELWDAYDENLNLIQGLTLMRGEPIPQGVYHLVADVTVRHKDGSYLLMQRALCKHNGGKWEASAGGSALQGETPIAAAKRELEEETGVVANTFVEIARAVRPETHSVYVEFFCEVDCEKDSVCCRKGETMAYRWVSKEELLRIQERGELTTKAIDYRSLS